MKYKVKREYRKERFRRHKGGRRCRTMADQMRKPIFELIFACVSNVMFSSVWIQTLSRFLDKMTFIITAHFKSGIKDKKLEIKDGFPVCHLVKVESDWDWMKANTHIVEEYDTFVFLGYVSTFMCRYNYNLLSNEILLHLIVSVWFSSSHKSTQSKHP